jgi:hypothetical protein
MQYWYGLFADLATAYNELRNEALRLNLSKAAEPSAFNRHLLLGSLPAEPSLALPSPFRTAFQQAPIFNNQAEQLQRVCFLHGRLVMMMKCFYAPNYEWDDTATDSVLTPSADVNADNEAGIAAKINMPIRLTPSGPLSMPLGKRTIPYYFDLARSEQSLHWYWDFDATQQNRTDSILSYHSENEDAFVKLKDGDFYAGTEGGSYTDLPQIIHPFVFDVRATPFVRIEGHIGKIGNPIIGTATVPTDFSIINPKGKVEKQTLLVALKSFAQRFNICFNVEIHPVSALVLSPNNLTGFCGKCLDQLGGVYHGGTFYIFYEAVKEPKGDGKFKIVADFTALDR